MKIFSFSFREVLFQLYDQFLADVSLILVHSIYIDMERLNTSDACLSLSPVTSRGLESLIRAMSFLRVALSNPSCVMMRLTEQAGLNRLPNGSTIPAYTVQSPGLEVL